MFLNRPLQNLNSMETSSVWLPATVVARPPRWPAISSLCILRRPATKRGNYTKWHIQPGTWGCVQAQGYRHTAQCYDYMSDNLAEDFITLNRHNSSGFLPGCIIFHRTCRLLFTSIRWQSALSFFVTRQVVWNFRNDASERINIVKRWKTSVAEEAKGWTYTGFPPWPPISLYILRWNATTTEYGVSSMTAPRDFLRSRISGSLMKKTCYEIW